MSVILFVILLVALTAVFTALGNARDNLYGKPFGKVDRWVTRGLALADVQRLQINRPVWDANHWHPVLVKHLVFYQNLTDGQQLLFRTRMEAFLYRVPITPVSFELVERDYIFVAASAIVPVFFLKEWMYPQLKEVIMHSSAFGTFENGQGQHMHTVGLTGTQKLSGIVYLARDVLWADIMQHKPSNVAIHEFVHVLDLQDGQMDGVPLALLSEQMIDPWVELMLRETQQLQGVDDYARESPAEFLAVLSEYFFTRPVRMQQSHPRLYEMMRRMYGPQV